MVFLAEEMALEKKNPKEDGKKMTLPSWFLDVFRIPSQFVWKSLMIAVSKKIGQDHCIEDPLCWSQMQ